MKLLIDDEKCSLPLHVYLVGFDKSGHICSYNQLESFINFIVSCTYWYVVHGNLIFTVSIKIIILNIHSNL